MQNHIDNTTRQLGELAAMSHQTEAAERKILASATARLGVVQDDIEKIRGGALAGDTSQQYQDLIIERGQLQQVIAKSNSVLSV